jgi:hypothetical protein
VLGCSSVPRTATSPPVSRKRSTEAVTR